MKIKEKCAVDGCNRLSYGRKLMCQMHLKRLQRRGKITTSRIIWNNMTIRNMFFSAKARAKRANLPFSLTPDSIKIPDTCPILGIPIVCGVGHHCDSSPSLDRIRPKKGYIPSNIQVISYKANRLKSDGSAEDLMKIALYVKTIEEECTNEGD